MPSSKGLFSVAYLHSGFVLDSLSFVPSCFRKEHSGFKRKDKIIKEASPLHQVHWNRVILDEAHNIKERSTNTAKATFELKATSRWCLSGTPLQNRVGELYSLVRFLGGDPFSYYFCQSFNTFRCVALIDIRWKGKACDCKSLHWRFSDKKSCDGVSSYFYPIPALVIVLLFQCADCGHSPMQHVLISLLALFFSSSLTLARLADLFLEHRNSYAYSEARHDRPRKRCFQKTENLAG